MTVISVVLPFRDAERHIAEAIESILSQRVENFELLAVDDESSDGSREIVEAFARRDSRINVLRSKASGLPAALNTGIAAVRSPFLARMDADDIALPGRFEAQLNAFGSHSRTAVVGTAAQLIDANGQLLETAWFPTEPDAVRAALRGGCCCLCHPSTMIRTDTIRAAGGYRDSVPLSEDFDLWLRLSVNWELRNLDRPFLRYRLHAHSASFSRTQEQLVSFLRALALAKRPETATVEKLAVPALLRLHEQSKTQSEVLAWLGGWYMEHAALMGDGALTARVADAIAGLADSEQRPATRMRLGSQAALYARSARGLRAAARELSAAGTGLLRDRALWQAILFQTRATVRCDPPSSVDHGTNGYLDETLVFDGGRVALLFGWTRAVVGPVPRRLVVHAPCPGRIRSFRLVQRDDVADEIGMAYRYSGFRVEVELERALRAEERIGVWSKAGADLWRPTSIAASSSGA